MTARWEITRDGDLVEQGVNETLEAAFEAAVDWLLDGGKRVLYASLSDAETAVIDAAYVNPASVEVRDYLITTELVA